MSLFIPRDLSWLIFNARVLQEAKDKTVPLHWRIKFLSIFSSNLDEFFRIRISNIKKSFSLSKKGMGNLYYDQPREILAKINALVAQLEIEFESVWNGILDEMALQKVFIKNTNNLTSEQQKFVINYYENEVETNIIPLLLNPKSKLPFLNDLTIYLGIKMLKNGKEPRFAIIEIPRTSSYNRFVILPSKSKGNTEIILLEDIIIYNIPHILKFLGYDNFQSYIFKITKNADFDIKSEEHKTKSLEEIVKKGVIERRLGKATRLIYEKNMDPVLIDLLIRKIKLQKSDVIIPGKHVHNFKDFINFPQVFKNSASTIKIEPFIHPDFDNYNLISDIILKKDVLLCFPYHSFRSVIDFLVEAAMDPHVEEINITAYRLAQYSKIMNALINAARNGKKVNVVMELRARFNEVENINWKQRLEIEGVRVLVGLPDEKIHCKICVIKKRINKKTLLYGFVSTGNLNETTAKLYADNMLLTSHKIIMSELLQIFSFIKNPKKSIFKKFSGFKNVLLSPGLIRAKMLDLIDTEITQVKLGKKAEIIIKLNALNDLELMLKLIEAADHGVEIKLIVRGIYSLIHKPEWKQHFKAISIIDEYLEHARLIYFYHKGDPQIYLSSADWMIRNLDARIEVAVKIDDPKIQNLILAMLNLQLKDNVKARILGENLNNDYVQSKEKEIRYQKEMYKLLKQHI